MDKARLDFEETLHKQSRTYAAACDEYRRRYKIEPPPGFEDWFLYASAQQSPIIDDYDAIYDSILPLLRISGKEINENIVNARNLPGNDLWTSKGDTPTTKQHPYQPEHKGPVQTTNMGHYISSLHLPTQQYPDPRPPNPAQAPNLPFVTDPKQAKNLCLHPEYSTKHGIFLSPTSFRPITGLLPILSTGSLSTMTDILYPSPAYLAPDFQYTPEKDIP
ncbi:uncharacterized protein BO87DRAFT_417226 [Aspergillus neoniger CBS 115656]|uniref:Uncharacterized protein n=1 Tax=Aspergillus neoniger (strain CBS 115656) TaxID=1448310 RepID=A0A318YDM3_ASPNB|nr:hypothetical protein BO87DRAFT_417226 [Aspergillus neoniger CBS 115656]PYH32531.1 hypothetical protein BO87DRAFT_417226 [Aspergillus neoniger CBS 115656]